MNFASFIADCNCSFASSNRTFTVDTKGPNITLVSPINNSIYTTVQSVNFTYNVTDLSKIVNCSLWLSDANATTLINNETDTTITEDVDQTFNVSYLKKGEYLWLVECVDSHINKTNSSKNNLSIRPAYPGYSALYNPGFEDDSGEPVEYFIRQSTSGANPMEMGIHPVPGTVSGDKIYSTYFSQATDLSGDSDVPFEGLRHLYGYHDLLSHYVSGKLLLLEGMINRATAYRNLYETGTAIMRDRIGRAPNYNPGMVTRPQ